MQALIEEVASLFQEKGWTLSCAESCTGGSLAYAFTQVSGASAYFLGGAVCYSNLMKQQMVQVSSKTLDRFGAVSEEVAVEMAHGIQQVTGSSWSLATTGIAGPTGASAGKSIGTICIALCDLYTCQVKTFHFTGSRGEVMERTVQEAIGWLVERVRSDTP